MAGLKATLVWVFMSLFLSLASAQKGSELLKASELRAAKQKYGPLAERRLLAWQTLVDENRGRPERLLLTQVNNFFREVTFSSDQTVWNKNDYWATPAEFLARDAGDAEDFVIAKYFTLLSLGVAEEKLYFTYASSSRLRRAHMVLTYFRTPRSQPLILDSVTDRILKAGKRPDLKPIYSFNGQDSRDGQTVKSGMMDEWNRMLERMRQGRIN